jgi:hypothetical protein
MRIKHSFELPTKCSYCNQNAIEFITYHFSNLFGLDNGAKFFCSEHLKLLKRLTDREENRVLLGMREL